jgi:threonyl-tRNA synthetase
MVHRALLGSIERFFGILIEHYAGAFPLWLAPEQVRVLPITDKQLDYARQIEKTLREAGFRVEVDTGAEKLGAKIRSAQLWKTPYMLIVGGRDEEAGVVSVRSRADGDKGQMKLEEFIAELRSIEAARQD